MTFSKRQWDPMKKLVCIIVCILVVAWGAGYFLSRSGEENAGTSNSDAASTSEASSESEGEATDSEQNAGYYDLGDGVTITGIDSYTGDYVEDGSDELVQDIMMITIENTGENSYQLMNLTVNGQYHFQLTTLLPGMTMMVLETDRAAYDQNMSVDTVEASDVAVFTDELSLCEDIYSIETSDGALTISNVTDSASPEAKVFYKNKVSTGYLGGITYCVSVPSLDEEESITIESGHYTEEGSELLFVTHGE